MSSDKGKYVEWAKRITYKPNVFIHVEEDMSYITIRLTYDVPDADTNYNTQITHRNTVSKKSIAGESFDGFVRWFKSLVHQAETHEANEWIRVDGVKIFDPHKDDAGFR